MGINKDMGLPHGDGMEKVAICFDVDGTLIDGDTVHESTKALVRILTHQKWKNVDFIVWSGGGADYARTMFTRHIMVDTFRIKFYSKLQYEEVRSKYDKIIAIDDVQDTRLGDINLIVRNK